MMTPTKSTNILLLYQLCGVKVSSVYTLLLQKKKKTHPIDCFTVFRRCAFTLDEIFKKYIALIDTNIFIDATRPTTLSLACSSVFAQSLKLEVKCLREVFDPPPPGMLRLTAAPQTQTQNKKKRKKNTQQGRRKIWFTTRPHQDDSTR